MLDAVLRESLSRHADKRVIDELGVLRFAELDQLAARYARALIDAGFRPGDRVAAVAQNSRWGAAAYLGVWKAGGVLVPLNPAFTVPEIAYLLGHASPRAVFADADRLGDVRRAAQEAGEPIPIWTSDLPSGDPEVMALSELPAAGELWPEREWPEVACILYTSGTTGRPRGAMITGANMLFVQDIWRCGTQVSERDVVLCALPIFHSYALVLLYLCALTTGYDLVLEQGFQFPRLWRLLSEHRVTVLPAIPPVHEAIATLNWKLEDYDLSALRLTISGAAPLAQATLDKSRERLGNPQFLDGYGITETSSILSIGPVDQPNPPGASGKPLPGVEVRIVDGDGRDLGAGSEGEIWVKCAGLMKGYYRDPEATAAAFTDGWYRTGDVGRLGEDGYLYVSDRIKDLIIVSGENVSSREVETAILDYPGVARAAVIGMATADTGEAPLAFVVPEPGATITVRELLAFLRQRLTAYKVPRKVRIVDDLPTSPSGKVLKRELRP